MPFNKVNLQVGVTIPTWTKWYNFISINYKEQNQEEWWKERKNLYLETDNSGTKDEAVKERRNSIWGKGKSTLPWHISFGLMWGKWGIISENEEFDRTFLEDCS